MDRRFAVVVLDEMAADREPALRQRLGPELDDEVRRVVREHVLAWARTVPGTLHEVRRAADVPALLEGHDGPVLLVAPDVPHLDAHHLEAACADLDDGITLIVGQSNDASPFLLVLAERDDELIRGAARPLGDLTGIAAAAGGSFGMLRPERRLASLADARAWRADPVAPLGLRELLPAGL